LLNRRAERELLPYALAHNLGVVVRGPLQKGLLTGKFGRTTTFPPGDIRAGWPGEAWYQDQRAIVERLRPLARTDRTLGQLALQFVLDHRAVSVAIPGAKTPAQVEENAQASIRPLLTAVERPLIDVVASAAV